MVESDLQLAQSCDKIIRDAARAVERASLRIGWFGLILKRKNLFHDLGFDDEIAYYQSCGIGRSTWFRALEIASSLSHLPREKVLSMKIENARMLAKATVQMRTDSEVVDFATTMPCRNFERMIKESEPQTRFGVAKIRRLELIVEMSDKDRKAINAVIEEWMNRHNVKDRGIALREIVEFAASMMQTRRFA